METENPFDSPTLTIFDLLRRLSKPTLTIFDE
jgi:hypothetical protein